MDRRYQRLSIIGIIIVIVDQSTKLFIANILPIHQSIEVIRGYFSITHIRNRGAAFGIFSGIESASITIFFIIVSLIAITAIIFFFRSVEKNNYLAQIALSLILGGATGNFLDRIRLGEVIDFLDFYWHQYHWPAFNIADSSITIGAGILIWDIVIVHRRDAEDAEKNEE